MSPNLGHTARNILRRGGPVVVALCVLTVFMSVAAGAHVPRIKKPGAPTAVTAVPLDGGAAVSWAAPASDGGSPIVSYVATASNGGQTCTATETTSCTLTGLANGRRYTVRVRAINAKGDGPSARIKVTHRRRQPCRSAKLMITRIQEGRSASS